MRDNHYTQETGKIFEQNDFSVPQKSTFLTLLLKFWAAAFCSEQDSLPRNGSERNSDSLFLYLFHGTEFRVVFSPLKGSEGNSESMLLFFFNCFISIKQGNEICTVTNHASDIRTLICKLDTV